MSDIDDVILKAEDHTYKIFPFLSQFPFKEYDIFYSTDEGDSNLDQEVIDNSSSNLLSEFINFTYLDANYIQITVSFYYQDIALIRDRSENVKKLDKIRESLDEGLKSKDLLQKIDSIKKGQSLVNKVDKNLLAGPMFDKILDEFISLSKLKLDKDTIKKLKSRNKEIGELKLSPEAKKVINNFYDMHLNHIKIILGIIIAAKLD